MQTLLLYLADDRNLMLFRRRIAIFVGFGMLLISTLMVAICAMGPKTPEQGLYVALSIAGCFWLEVTIFLAARYPARAWPSVLILVTSSVYVAAACTFVIPDLWIALFYWVCVCITAIGGAIEIRRRDFAGSADCERATAPCPPE
jgi:hypothetical protein